MTSGMELVGLVSGQMPDSGIRPLTDLHVVDWAGLTHAYGSAGDIPRMLHALAELPPVGATEADITSYRRHIDETEHQIWSAVLHQGNLYEATAAALPFVIWLLVHRPALRPVLVDWLTDLSWVNDDAATGGPIAECRAVLSAAIADIAGVLDDDNPYVRASVAGFLGSCQDNAAAAWSAIASRWVNDPDPGVQADELISMGALAQAADRLDTTAGFVDSWAHGPDRARRIAAAHARLMMDGDDQSSRALLVATLSPELDHQYRLGYWWGSGGAGTMVESLACGSVGLRDPQMLSAVLAVIPDAERQGTGFVAGKVLGCVLSQVFVSTEPMPSTSNELSGAQRQVLQFLASGQVRFTRDGVVLDTAHVMTRFQLPPDAVALRQWLNGGVPSSVNVTTSVVSVISEPVNITETTK